MNNTNQKLVDYNPNAKMEDVQEVRLTFQCWEYTKTFETKVRDNCRGLDIINSAVESIADQLYDEETECIVISLINSDGGELECTDDMDQGEDYLKSMLVSAEIISINRLIGEV